MSTVNKTAIKRIGLVSLGVFIVWQLAAKASDNAPRIPLESPAMTKALGWVTDEHDPDNICRGYFQEPRLDIAPVTHETLAAGKVQIRGTYTSFSQHGTSILHKPVVSQPGQRVSADIAYLYRDVKTGKINRIDMVGHVVNRQSGRLLRGSKAILYLDPQRGSINNAMYYIAERPQRPSYAKGAGWHQVRGRTMWGQSDHIHQQDKQHYTLRNATYSVCSPRNVSWHLLAKDLQIDKEKGRATAYNAWLYAKSIPVFYTPYASFPIDNRRQSGFLLPEIGNSSRNGFSLSLPYYFNLAPNYDLTLTPYIYSKRGILFTSLLRYLTKTTSGQLQFSIIPHDRAFAAFQQSAASNFPNASASQQQQLADASATRKYISFKQQTQFNKNWQAKLDYNYASDDYVIDDFNNTNNFTNAILDQQYQLNRQASLSYTNQHWQASALLQSYQTLQPMNLGHTIQTQYSREPQVDIAGEYDDLLPGLDFNISSQAVRFRHKDDGTDSFSGKPFAEGERYNIKPELSWSYSTLGAYITPSVKLQATHYQLDNKTGWSRRNLTRTVPIFSLDSGLVFEKPWHLPQQDVVQTLEPRFYYLYVPYREQRDMPVFDSMRQNFTYDQLFRDNRFAGIDRVGDANQIALGLTSRLLDVYGQERLSFGLGQLYYFRDRDVSLCSTNADCVQNEDPFFREKSSPIASQLRFNLIPGLSVSSDFAWNTHEHRTDNLVLSARYRPTTKLNLYGAYTYDTRATLINDNQIDFAANVKTWTLGGIWRFTPQWSLISGLNYEFIANNPEGAKSVQNYTYGLQYDSCCFAWRLLAGRMYDGVKSTAVQYDKRIFFQFVFKGLGAVGQNQANDLIDVFVPGYKDEFSNQQQRVI